MATTRQVQRVTRRAALCLGVGVLLLSGCNAGTPPVEEPTAQPAGVAQSMVPPAVSINALMVAWIDHSGHELWDVEQAGRAPQTDTDWRNLERHATQLAAAGTLISLGGTGEYDMEWVEGSLWGTHAQALTDAALACLEAARSKDFDALVTANGQLTDTCEGCHADFKPTLPTEGILHQPY